VSEWRVELQELRNESLVVFGKVSKEREDELKRVRAGFGGGGREYRRGRRDGPEGWDG
jgi:hypothetical protein